LITDSSFLKIFILSIKNNLIGRSIASIKKDG